jgi:hypothetical protein
VAYENNGNNEHNDNQNGPRPDRQESVYSKRIKAGKRRTYFFDVRETRGNDYYLTITESRKRFDSDGYDRHKIFLYKEDFNKFYKGLGEAIEYVKTDLMPDFDFDAFNHDTPYEGDESKTATQQIDVKADETNTTSTLSEPNIEVEKQIPSVEQENNKPDNGSTEQVDKW